ncbi:unnamed protein product [Spirodela intermedia]|uniref:ATP-grasp domain-containing protein n=1 Tax=Spirodela intermedia TaxID=51605 RepID=A0A7I8IAQ3_SPIIN|nr:unnamed protein product [Spirodela intermedia]CAA6654670.1 unnamed protein product [Spirodela intermedia]
MASLFGASPLLCHSIGRLGAHRSTSKRTHLGKVRFVAPSGSALWHIVSQGRCSSRRDVRAQGSEVNVGVIGCKRLERGSEKVPEDKEHRLLKVGIICGGPSAERGISLNSARSVLDHIQGDDLHVSCYYIDGNLNAYALSPAQLYCNTPADFDFKLDSLAQGFGSLPEFAEHLSHSIDIAFPVIHGRFGEDGGIQELLESLNIPFIGTCSKECRKAFDKYNASQELKRQGFVTVPNFLVEGSTQDTLELLKWFTGNKLDKNTGKVVVKPIVAGSSIGVTVAYGADDAMRKASRIISEGIDDKVLIEVFLEGGSEFTAIVIDIGSGSDCHPVVLLPTEVELQCHDKSSTEEDEIFDYRRKYLPTQQVAYHTPPRFSEEIIHCIRKGAELLFKSLGLRDFARIDGWFLPSPPPMLHTNENTKFGHTGSGTVVYTDINLISGMEQTSFLFQQASKVGFSHANILRTIIQRACLRFPSLSFRRNILNVSSGRRSSLLKNKIISKSTGVQKVFVLFGGETSERQVSLMSGTNVWLNLQSFDDLDVTPCLLAPANGYFCKGDKNEVNNSIPMVVWSLPYSIVLRHTTEEVFAACLEAIEPARAAFGSRLRGQVMSELEEGLKKHGWFSGFDIYDDLPKKVPLDEWIRQVKDADAVVFIAVHGGIGENGRLQSVLESSGVPYTGPGPMASKTCIDKVATSLSLEHLKSSGVLTIPKVVLSTEKLSDELIVDTWHKLTRELQCSTLCVKPARDGCSTGVARLCSAEDLSVYAKAVTGHLLRLPANSLSKAHGVIEMPSPPPKTFILEPFGGDSQQLIWKGESEWVEVTVGIMGKLGEVHSFNPSITVKETSDILSLEEKFQGGTGINLTPPPRAIINEAALQRCKQRIEMIANTLRLEGISRIDAFVNVRTGEVMVIEANTVPGMTPSTVLIHQALAEDPPIYPREFFRMILDLGLQRSKQLSSQGTVKAPVWEDA